MLEVALKAIKDSFSNLGDKPIEGEHEEAKIKIECHIKRNK